MSDELIYQYWLREGMPALFLYQSQGYEALKNDVVTFVTVQRGANPERADELHLWDGLYGPYGRILNQATVPTPTFTTLSLSDGSIMTFDNGHTVEIST